MAFYRDVDKQLCQGDIFDDVPSVLLKPPLGVLRKRTIGGGAETWEVIGYPFDPTPADGNTAIPPKRNVSFDFKSGEQVPAFCQVSRALLLTHGCEIDKDKKHRLVALVRPLASSIAPDSREYIRNNQKFSYFHLPVDPSRNLEESYVDFRRITCVAPELLEQGQRLVSLTDEAVAALSAQLFLFLTRREIKDRLA